MSVIIMFLEKVNNILLLKVISERERGKKVTKLFTCLGSVYIMVKNCDFGLENVVLGPGPWQHFQDLVNSFSPYGLFGLPRKKNTWIFFYYHEIPCTLKPAFFFKQVAHEIPAPDCDAFVELGSKTICDVAEAVSLIKQAQNMYVSFTTLQGAVIWCSFLQADLLVQSQHVLKYKRTPVYVVEIIFNMATGTPVFRAIIFFWYTSIQSSRRLVCICSQVAYQAGAYKQFQ